MQQTEQAVATFVQSTRSAMGIAADRSPHQAGQQSAEETTDSTAQLQQSYQLLIEPIADLLPTDPDAQIIFVPYKDLFQVPFAALQDTQGKYLIEQHTIRIAPAIQVLDLTHRQQRHLQKGDKALIVGNPTMPSIGEPPIPLPRLPNAEQEAKSIAQLFNTQALTGKAATEPVVVREMPEAKIIHLATHGYSDPNSNALDYIALAPTATANGLLTESEIVHMPLQADLVVLSACDSGRGQLTSDGVVGLSRSFLTAGSASVIASLWKVPDQSTAILMKDFYRRWMNIQITQNQTLTARALVALILCVAVGAITGEMKWRQEQGQKSTKIRRWAARVGLTVLIPLLLLTTINEVNAARQPHFDKAQALRQAMLTVMHQPKARPVDWAAFILLGEAQ